ncbi:UNVERIFIED_CONTAM: hypothetical protein Sindi_0061900 [Sesamum indicum]
MELGPEEGSSKPQEEYLIAGLKHLVVAGWKCENGFSNGYLAQLEAHMAKNFPQSDIEVKPHITSKLHVWKKHYRTLTTMLTKSGLGWDESQNMVMVEDDNAWDDYVKFQMDPNAKGMHYKTWPFFSSCREIFGKDRATRNYGADPYKNANDIRNEKMADTQDCYVPNAEWNPDIGFVEMEEEPTSLFNMNVDSTMKSSNATK